MSAVSSVQSYSLKLNDEDKARIVREIYPHSAYTFESVDEVIDNLRKRDQWGLFDSPMFARSFLTPSNLEIVLECTLPQSERDYARFFVDATFERIIRKNKPLYLLPADYSDEYLYLEMIRNQFEYLYNFLARFANKLRQQKLASSPITKNDIKHIKLPRGLTKGSPGMTHTAVVVQQLVKTGLLVETGVPDKQYKFQNCYVQEVFLARYLYKRDLSDGWLNELNSVDSILANEALFCSFFVLLREKSVTSSGKSITPRIQKCLQHILRVFEEACPLTNERMKAKGPCTKETHSFLPESELNAPRYALFFLKCINECGYHDVSEFREETRKIFYMYTLYAFDHPQSRLEDIAAFIRLQRLWYGEALTPTLCALLKVKSTRLIGLNLLLQVKSIGERLQYIGNDFHHAITKLYEQSDDLEEIMLITQIFSKYLLNLIKARAGEALRKDITIELFLLIKDERIKTLIRNHLKDMPSDFSLSWYKKYFEPASPSTTF